MSGLAAEQVEFLLAPITPGRVQHAQGQAHLAAWDVRRTLLRAFGWGGWSYDLADVTLVHERETQDGQRSRWSAVYRVTLTLSIRDRDGHEVASFTEAATGDAQNQKSPGDAHDMALKTAESQALKRAAMNLGDQFGLSLYAGGRTDAVVIRSLPHLPGSDAPQLPQAEDVTAGEDDAHAQAPTALTAPPVQPRPPEAPAEAGPVVLAPDVAEQWLSAIQAAADVDALKAVYDDARKGGQLKALVPDEHGEGKALAQVISNRKAELQRAQPAGVAS